MKQTQQNAERTFMNQNHTNCMIFTI